VDVDNLPPEFARFERIEKPNVATTFEVVEGPVYTWVDGMVKDVWAVRPMTDEERAQKTQDLTQSANAAIEYMKGIAQQNADSAPSDEAKQAWLDYLTTLSTWTLVDPVNPDIPMPPRIGADGKVLTTTAPGSAPNVIG
jgi:hypothetical protein